MELLLGSLESIQGVSFERAHGHAPMLSLRVEWSLLKARLMRRELFSTAKRLRRSLCSVHGGCLAGLDSQASVFI